MTQSFSTGVPHLVRARLAREENMTEVIDVTAMIGSDKCARPVGEEPLYCVGNTPKAVVRSGFRTFGVAYHNMSGRLTSR